MSEPETGVEEFCAFLAASLSISPPNVKCDAPISKDAQYSPVIQQIQYRDDADMLVSLSESGGIAPVRWTLHEFAHHIQHEYCLSYDEDFARWVTNEYSGQVQSAWQAAVVDGVDRTTLQSSYAGLPQAEVQAYFGES